MARAATAGSHLADVEAACWFADPQELEMRLFPGASSDAEFKYKLQNCSSVPHDIDCGLATTQIYTHVDSARLVELVNARHPLADRR